jgi:hypothetical protein
MVFENKFVNRNKSSSFSLALRLYLNLLIRLGRASVTCQKISENGTTTTLVKQHEHRLIQIRLPFIRVTSIRTIATSSNKC